MQVILRFLAQMPDLAAWEARAFAPGAESGPTGCDRRAVLERTIGVESPGGPEMDGPYRRVAGAIMGYRIFPPALVTGILRRDPVQKGDTVGTLYHLAPGIDLFFASRVVKCFDEPVDGTWQPGFTYRTLAGHPLIGEETFSVEKDVATGRVMTALRSWSRPGILLARLTRPLMRWLQFRAGGAVLKHLEVVARRLDVG